MIYVIPSPLVENEEINFHQKTWMHEEITGRNFWYLHGVLQEKFHFDKAYMFVDYGTSKTERCQVIDRRLYLAPGIYNDIIVEGYDNLCRAYIWHQQIGTGEHDNHAVDLRGVIIDPSNEDDLAYAKKLYREKPFTF